MKTWDSTAGVQSNGPSYLVANDGNGHPDLFVRDRRLGKTTRLDVSQQGWNVGRARATRDGSRLAVLSGPEVNFIPWLQVFLWIQPAPDPLRIH